MSGTKRYLGDAIGSVHGNHASPEGDGISLSAVLDSVKDITQRLDQLNAKGITRIRPFRLRSLKSKQRTQQHIDVQNLIPVASVKCSGNSNSIELKENTSSLEVTASTKPALGEKVLSEKRAIQTCHSESDSSVKRHQPGPAPYTFDLDEEMCSFAEHLMKRECASDQDNRVVLKFCVKLNSGEGAGEERQRSKIIRTPNIQQGRRISKQKGHPTSLGSSIYSTQTEKYVEQEFWEDLENIEAQQGKLFRKDRERGMDTIICLDISDSMKGRPWEQAMTFAQRFVRGVQGYTKLTDTVFEHLGIAVFGHETKVIQHMTVDYVEILRKLESLRPDGPTPLFGGIQMCGAISFGSGARFRAKKIEMDPRILLITDGHLTKRLMVSGPDVLPSEDEDMEKAAVFALVTKLRLSVKFNIYPVPVGDADLDFLQMLASATDAKLIAPDKWEQTARFFKNVQIAGRVSAVAQMGTELLDLSGTKLDTEQLWAQPLQQLEDATDEDMEDVKEIIKHNKKEDNEDEYCERDPSMPNLGTRVKRGKDWKWNDQDCNSTGTVVTHSRQKGWVVVTWDKTINGKDGRKRYRYGAEGCYDVEVVNDPRILTDELIAVGCIVKRGVDWKWRDQDGGAGNTGVVLSVEPDGHAYVRWSYGHIDTYRFGYDGMFDLEVCHPMAEPQLTAHAQTKKNVTAAGARRGYSRVPNKNEIKDSIEMTSDDSRYITDMNMKNKQPITDECGSDKIERLNIMNLRNVQLSSKDETEQYIARNQSEHFESLDVQSKSDGFIWQWKDREGIWRSYASDINDKLEKTFLKNPKSSTVIYLGNTTYRIIFSRMQQLNTMTRACTEIQRLSPAR